MATRSSRRSTRRAFPVDGTLNRAGAAPGGGGASVPGERGITRAVKPVTAEGTMDVRTVGDSAMVGWRDRIGRRLAGPVAARTGLEASQVYAGLGIVFLALSAWYVATTLGRIARRGP